MSKKEEWKQIMIDKYLYNYDISDKGRVRNHTTHMEISQHKSSNGYMRVVIYKNGLRVNFSVHRLVAIMFIKIPKRLLKNGYSYDTLEVNHKNGDKTKNYKSNLEWNTSKENMQHAVKNNLIINSIGENSHLSKIKESDAIKCCELIMLKKNDAEISEILGISKKTINHIRNKSCWKHITSRYDFPKLGTSKPYAISESTIHKICKLISKNKYSDKEIAKNVELVENTLKILD